MTLDHIDHLVLTVRDLQASIRFYTQVLGMTHEVFGENRHTLKFGLQKINLHPESAPIQPHAATSCPGSADLCFITTTPLEQVIQSLQNKAVAIESGPVSRTGAQGPILSVYFRDPDGNLLAVSNQL
jgi:catechol 2,3-dioxygenase-like lactoylglutathione lyase family enzyme